MAEIIPCDFPGWIIKILSTPALFGGYLVLKSSFMQENHTVLTAKPHGASVCWSAAAYLPEIPANYQQNPPDM